MIYWDEEEFGGQNLIVFAINSGDIAVWPDYRMSRQDFLIWWANYSPEQKNQVIFWLNQLIFGQNTSIFGKITLWEGSWKTDFDLVRRYGGLDRL